MLLISSWEMPQKRVNALQKERSETPRGPVIGCQHSMKNPSCPWWRRQRNQRPTASGAAGASVQAEVGEIRDPGGLGPSGTPSGQTRSWRGLPHGHCRHAPHTVLDRSRGRVCGRGQPLSARATEDETWGRRVHHAERELLQLFCRCCSVTKSRLTLVTP